MYVFSLGSVDLTHWTEVPAIKVYLGAVTVLAWSGTSVILLVSENRSLVSLLLLGYRMAA